MVHPSLRLTEGPHTPHAGRYLTHYATQYAQVPVLEEEATCAEQIRQIVQQSHLKYDALVSDPVALLRATRHVDTEHGALYTRYTVQYNLYAGTVVALGSDEQRAKLF